MLRTTTQTTSLGLVLAAGLLSAAGAAITTTSKPNVIFILSDDLGYADNEVSHQMLPSATTRVPTPNMERMAKGGLKFLRGYSGQVCAPSRTTLMTGRHLGHTTIRGNDGAYTPLLKTDVTVAKVLKDAGYRTGLVGKWGLGNFGTSGYPLEQGFDYFVGQDTQVGCHDWYPTAICNNTNGTYPLNSKDELGYSSCLGSNSKCTWMNDLDKTLALDFITSSVEDKTPFFLYLSTTTPHSGFLSGSGPKPPFFYNDYPVPYPYNQHFANESWDNQQQQFAAAVWAQDVMIGAVIDELETLGIEKDTLIFFSGDNGPDDHDLSLFDDPGVFRGKKRSLHEGGIRQTILAYWPGTIAPGSSTSTLFAFWDFLPTAAELAGVPKSSLPEIDGVSAAGLLQGTSPPPPPGNRYLYYEFCDYNKINGLLPQTYDGGWNQAVRWDDNETTYQTEWKAIATDTNYSGILLYNITEDQSESNIILPAPTGVTVSPVVARARDIIITMMKESHVENPYWKSSQNKTDRCCASCFKPGGCPPPCKLIPNPPQPQLSESITGKYDGIWFSQDSQHQFQLKVGENYHVSIRSLNESLCLSSGHGMITQDMKSMELEMTCSLECNSCPSLLVGSFVLSERKHHIVNRDYHYNVDTFEIEWNSEDSAAWPTLTRSLRPSIILD